MMPDPVDALVNREWENGRDASPVTLPADEPPWELDVALFPVFYPGFCPCPPIPFWSICQQYGLRLSDGHWR